MTNGSGIFPQHTKAARYQPCYLAFRVDHVFISCTMASWRRLLLIRGRIHQDFILTYCLRQTKMSPRPAATGTFITNAAPRFRTERYSIRTVRPSHQTWMNSYIAVVPFISVTQISSLDPPNGFDPAGKWPPAVSSLELIRRRGTAASTAAAACGSGRYRPEVATGKTSLCLAYLGGGSATWNPFSRVLVLWLSGTLRWFIIICFLFVLFPTKENKLNNKKKKQCSSERHHCVIVFIL